MVRIALILSLLASPALAFQSQNGLRVTQSAGQIEVAPSPGQSAPASWCAAGEFVISQMGLPPSTPIWRLSEPPRKAGQGVMFSLTANGAAQKSGVIQFGDTDAAFTAAAAQALCWTL